MDDRVKNLGWFKNEALTLQKQMNQYKREVDKWKHRCNNLEYDNNFLEKQVIAVKRQNKCLKIALGKSQEHCQILIDEIHKYPNVVQNISKDLLVIGKGGNITLEEKLLLKDTGELTKYSFTPQSPLESDRSQKSQNASKIGFSSPKVYENKPRAFVDYITELRLSKEDFASELERYLGKQEQRFQTVISSIKALLEKEKLKNRKLGTALAKKETQTFKEEITGLFQGKTSPKMPDSTRKVKNFNISSK